MKRRIAVAVVAVWLTGCASALPPHQWIPVGHVEAVDLFWWPEQHECDLRVIFQDLPGQYRGFTVPLVDPRLCGAPPKQEPREERD